MKELQIPNNETPIGALLREVHMRNDQKEIETAVHELLSFNPPVDALLIGTNKLAISALRYIASLPIKVPKDLAIVGFDETESFDFFYAPLTYIKQPLQEMGKKAIHILLDEIKIKMKPEQVVMRAELIIPSIIGEGVETSTVNRPPTTVERKLPVLWKMYFGGRSSVDGVRRLIPTTSFFSSGNSAKKICGK